MCRVFGIFYGTSSNEPLDIVYYISYYLITSAFPLLKGLSNGLVFCFVIVAIFARWSSLVFPL